MDSTKLCVLFLLFTLLLHSTFAIACNSCKSKSPPCPLSPKATAYCPKDRLKLGARCSYGGQSDGNKDDARYYTDNRNRSQRGGSYLGRFKVAGQSPPSASESDSFMSPTFPLQSTRIVTRCATETSVPATQANLDTDINNDQATTGGHYDQEVNYRSGDFESQVDVEHTITGDGRNEPLENVESELVASPYIDNFNPAAQASPTFSNDRMEDMRFIVNDGASTSMLPSTARNDKSISLLAESLG
ncbi:hypothetical protein V6N11_074655 [Hibiscus sabdariffa]|uniref:Uncharacterized protein n=1 Tax=Hibiscus sabdariffa TaxID=183260 RepID=A0ABR2R462_9ROSI